MQQVCYHRNGSMKHSVSALALSLSAIVFIPKKTDAPKLKREQATVKAAYQSNRYFVLRICCEKQLLFAVN